MKVFNFLSSIFDSVFCFRFRFRDSVSVSGFRIPCFSAALLYIQQKIGLLKEGTTSVNSNYKSSHVASNLMVICIMLPRRVMYEILKNRSRSLYLNLFFILHENNLSTNVF